jgi:hypothetical protein
MNVRQGTGLTACSGTSTSTSTSAHDNFAQPRTNLNGKGDATTQATKANPVSMNVSKHDTILQSIVMYLLSADRLQLDVHTATHVEGPG